MHYKLVFKNKTIYSGEILNGRPDGKGRLLWPNGDTYEGDWV